MMRKGGAALICLGVLAGVGMVRLAQQPIRLASLADATQYAIIDFRSEGCFHSEHYRLRYEPAPTPRLLVADCGPDWGKGVQSAAPTAKHAAKPMATVELTPEQVRRLDNMLLYYRRHNNRGGCTTRDIITVSLHRRGLKLRTESYEDATCRSQLLADADPRDLVALKIDGAPALSLRAVVAAAAQAKKRAADRVRYVTLPRNETAAYQEVRAWRRVAHTDQLARTMAEELEGYDALRREFRVESVMLGNINMQPYSLHPTLRAVRPRLVDAAWWFDPVEEERPRYNWNQFLAVHREVERVAGAHTWIGAWKQAGPDRSVEGQISGLTPTTETDLSIFVIPAWKHAGLKGRPEYQLLLRRDGQACITLYLGKEDRRALIVDAQPFITGRDAGSEHWLDGMRVSYHPKQVVPDYLVVTPDGTWTRNRLPKRD